MEFKDYYKALGLARNASADEIKRAYRKLARKYHPDVSKEPDAEARFKEVAEAHEALHDVERRAAYDEIEARYRQGYGQSDSGGFNPPPGWASGFEFSGNGADGGGFGAAGDAADYSAFFEQLFGRHARRAAEPGHGHGAAAARARAGGDHHARISITLLEAYRGGERSLSLRMPQADGQGHVALVERVLTVNIPKGVRNGQQLRLAGQGGPGSAGAPAGDLYLEIEITAHRWFRVDGRDVYLDLPVAPWEAALGASVMVPTPDGRIELTVPPGSKPGRKLRLKGQGLPSQPPGDFYVLLSVALPPADSDAAQQAYRTWAGNFAGFDPRSALEIDAP